MLQVTDKGITVEQLAEIVPRLETGFRQIYGEDINVDADTPDGQMIGLFAKEIDNINQLIAMVIQMLDPYKAMGIWLDQRALYAGLVRRGAAYSYLEDVRFSGKAGTVVPQDSVFSCDGVRWVTLADVVLDADGGVSVNLRSQNVGSYNVSENKALKSETVILGLTDIVTTKASKTGETAETDGEFLKRFMRSHSINNHDDREGLDAALSALPDVRQVKVYENYTGETDEKGIPGHTLNAVLIGGNDDDIVNILLQKKIGGCGLFGSIEKVIRYRNANRTVRFDRAESVDIRVSVVLERVSNFQDIDTDTIVQNLADTQFTIGESVYATRLACQVNSSQGFYFKSITVNGSDKAQIDYRQCARIKTENVEVLIE